MLYSNQISKLEQNAILPNAENAIVDIAKLEDYALNLEHPTGKHKARVFKSVLGLGKEDARFLQGILSEIVKNHPATEHSTISYGRRFFIDFELTTSSGTAIIRSVWIIRNNENFPRLTSCYVKLDS